MLATYAMDCPLHVSRKIHPTFVQNRRRRPSGRDTCSPANGIPAEVDFLQRLRCGHDIRDWAYRLADQLARYHRKLRIVRARQGGVVQNRHLLALDAGRFDG